MPRAPAHQALSPPSLVGEILVARKQQIMEGSVCRQSWVQGRNPFRSTALTTMAKPGRNDPCHCGSGKKYKKCCQPKELAAEGEVIAKEQVARAEREVARRLEQKAAKAAALEHFHEMADVDEELEELTTASNAAVDLVNAGKLEEAEAAARDLIARYPEVHDGWDRLGMMYEAKGDNKAAADCYRRALTIIRERPRQYDPEFAQVFVDLVAKLDPPAAS
jgi:tetratricopeptide (TPR) repeat protein